MSLICKTTRTPNPALRSLIVSVDEASLAPLAGVLPVEGTLFSDTSWKGIFPRDYMKLYSGFRYATQLEDTKDGAQLLFAKVRTDAEINTPFRSTSRFGNHYWPPVLKSLTFPIVTGFPYVIQTGASTWVTSDRRVVREVYIPSANEGSRFIEDEFTSDQPFSIPQYPVPTASAVSYHLVNINGGFPECLHKKIDILAIVGADGSTGGVVPGQEFPATNFTEWQPYVISDTQELTGGVYYRKRVRVFPPPEPKTIINTSPS